MANSTINANTNGLNSTAGNASVLDIQTGGVTAMSINASQIVSLTNPLPAASGGFAGVRAQVFTGNGTFTVPDGITQVKVTVVGGGGNGGLPTANTSAGAGGGAGGVAIKWITGLTPGAAISVTVGTAGNTSSFGAYCSATGGSAGGIATGNSTSTGGSGGTGSSGDINITGGAGGDSQGFSGCNPAYGLGAGGGSSGQIGSSFLVSTGLGVSTYSGGCGIFGLGRGGSGKVAFASNANQNGVSATGYGNGGGGAYRNTTAPTVGSGSGGIVIVEY